jgi:hypothetical protein
VQANELLALQKNQLFGFCGVKDLLLGPFEDQV